MTALASEFVRCRGCGTCDQACGFREGHDQVSMQVGTRTKLLCVDECRACEESA